MSEQGRRSTSEVEGKAIDLHEANFVSFREHGQSNVYGLTWLEIAGQNRLVVATVRAQIFCLEYQRDTVWPSLTPINFTYIPGRPSTSTHSLLTLIHSLSFYLFSNFPADAEVISIDAFVKKPNGVIFGVTLVKVLLNKSFFLFFF